MLSHFIKTNCHNDVFILLNYANLWHVDLSKNLLLIIIRLVLCDKIAIWQEINATFPSLMITV